MRIPKLYYLLAVLSLASCNDGIDVRQDYDFSLSTWYLPSGIKQGEPVEIRFTLWREGFFAAAEHWIGYTQIEGEGVVYDLWDEPLINREFRSLSSLPGLVGDIFTLYYRSTSEKNSVLLFTIRDNFGNERELRIEFQTEQ